MIGVGDLTKSFWKKSNRDAKVSKTPAESYAESTDGIALLSELTRRISNVEGRIINKVDKDGIQSGIVLSQEAILITSDKVGVLGDVSIFDYVRDQSGVATGQIDPSVTRIRGGVIQTEQIISGNLSGTEGTIFDLDNGDILIGGIQDPRFRYYSSDNTLTVRGIIAVEDLYDGTGQTIEEYGYFATGTAAFDLASGATGSGTISGSPGFYGLKDGTVKFSFEASTGDAFFGGDVDTEGYIKSEGNQDTGWDMQPHPDLDTYRIETSMYGYNTTSSTAINKIYSGLAGRVDGAAKENSSWAVGIFGLSDVASGTDPTSPADANRAGVMGVGSDNAAIGVFGISSQGAAVRGLADEGVGGQFGASDSGGGGVTGQGGTTSGWGGYFDASGGVWGVANSPTDHYGVKSSGVLGCTEHLEKLTQSKGVLKLYSTSSGSLQATWYYKFEEAP